MYTQVVFCERVHAFRVWPLDEFFSCPRATKLHSGLQVERLPGGQPSLVRHLICTWLAVFQKNFTEQAKSKIDKVNTLRPAACNQERLLDFSNDGVLHTHMHTHLPQIHGRWAFPPVKRPCVEEWDVLEHCKLSACDICRKPRNYVCFVVECYFGQFCFQNPGKAIFK